MAALDEALLGLRAQDEGVGVGLEASEQDDEALADVLASALAEGRLEGLRAELAAERAALEEALERRASSHETRTQEALQRSRATVRKLEGVEIDADALMKRAAQESERVRPLSQQVDASLTELAALANARAYAQSMIALKRLDASEEPSEDEIAIACDALSAYRGFLSHLRQGDLHIAKQFTSSIERAIRARRAALRATIQNSLDDLRWPVTASNEELRVSPTTLATMQSALASLVRLQLLHLKQTRMQAVSISGEFETEIWAVRALARPILQRFAYHFSGPRSTNRIDKPDWYHHFILDAVKDHAGFLADTVQPAVEQCMAPETFVDVIVHFVRCLVVSGLHRHYEAIWPFVEQSNALICGTLDESIALTEQLTALFGYQVGSSWPAPTSFFAATETRFIKWMSADLEFGRRKLEALLRADTAWNTVLDTIAQTEGKSSDLASSSFRGAGEPSWLPECAGFVVTLIDSVGGRADALHDMHARVLYLRMTQLPLLEDFAVELERRAAAVELHEEPSQTSLILWCRVLNAGVHVRQSLSAWEDLPRYAETTSFRANLGALTESMDTNLAEEMLRDTAKGKTNALRGLMRGILGRVRRPLQQKGAARPAGSMTNGSYGSSVGGDELVDEEGNPASGGIFRMQRDRLGGLVEAQVARFADILVRRFSDAARPYFRSCREGAMNRAESPLPHPGLADALAIVSDQLLRTLSELVASAHQQIVRRVANGIGAAFQHELLDVSRFSPAGATALERDARAVFDTFARFARRPDNRYFRSFKERVHVLSLPAHALKSLRQALRSFANEPREAARLLEEGHGLASLSVSDVEFLAAVRTDL
ncbi:RAD50-interacting protein 1 [Hondaea fermentalgiana]|uniref:RAD50-interacting protein 1 n=1 Tax=Hondaea fermentalgiana TaxID=2315210 RepID=A0A2R5G6G1_9STRA|nr:RAD50-interacting protein 1 [Hondaea fermentalgiana]|eukprot:GBG25909.1 RAD50-interacting protein 1 [Hondaea fermentalgiana]